MGTERTSPVPPSLDEDATLVYDTTVVGVEDSRVSTAWNDIFNREHVPNYCPVCVPLEDHFDRAGCMPAFVGLCGCARKCLRRSIPRF